MYLTNDEYVLLGFEATEDFSRFLKFAEKSINAYIDYFYDFNDFESDFEYRKKAVKLATAYQVSYLTQTGFLTASDSQNISSMQIGRTSVSYSSGSKLGSDGARYNLSIDALSTLKRAGFGYSGVLYDR